MTHFYHLVTVFLQCTRRYLLKTAFKFKRCPQSKSLTRNVVNVADVVRDTVLLLPSFFLLFLVCVCVYKCAMLLLLDVQHIKNKYLYIKGKTCQGICYDININM